MKPNYFEHDNHLYFESKVLLPLGEDARGSFPIFNENTTFFISEEGIVNMHHTDDILVGNFEHHVRFKVSEEGLLASIKLAKSLPGVQDLQAYLDNNIILGLSAEFFCSAAPSTIAQNAILFGLAFVSTPAYVGCYFKDRSIDLLKLTQGEANTDFASFTKIEKKACKKHIFS